MQHVSVLRLLATYHLMDGPAATTRTKLCIPVPPVHTCPSTVGNFAPTYCTTFAPPDITVRSRYVFLCLSFYAP